jgi:thiamine biosynthesis lipoprotein ApbE
MGSALLAAQDRALGTSVRVVVTQRDAGALAAAKAAVDRVLAEIDMACSRFRDDSELALLNTRSGHEHTVSPLLGRAIEVALHAAEVTDGDVDPTVGTAVRERGYDVDFASIPPDAGPITVVARPVPGWRCVRYKPATRTVYAHAGVELDLGATAKALAADLAAQAAIEALDGRGGVLVSLGGDIATAGVPLPEGWVVQVSEDSNQPFDKAAERVTLQGGAVATSSTTVRRWIRGGVEQHHIIDPRTGAPVQTLWRLVTVAADSCVHANTASTAAIIRGLGARDWLGRRGLAARLVDREGVIERVGGWPVPLPVEST